eukprot:158917-Prorocentrum_minimum.AAC.1
MDDPLLASTVRRESVRMIWYDRVVSGAYHVCWLVLSKAVVAAALALHMNKSHKQTCHTPLTAQSLHSTPTLSHPPQYHSIHPQYP